MQWMAAIVTAALVLGLWRRTERSRNLLLVLTVATVLVVWFTQMKP